MNEIILSDNMKKESRIYLGNMILFFVFTILFPFVAVFKDFTIVEIIIGDLLFLILGCLSLYSFLYAYKYNVTVTKESIELKTLFETVKLNISDIKDYSSKKKEKNRFL